MTKENRTEDEILKDMVIRAKEGDDLSTRDIVAKYTPMVHSIINKGLYTKNGDRDDLVQEGISGLVRAIYDFDETKTFNAREYTKSFYSFAYICSQRAIISAIKTGNRKKNRPLNDMVSLDSPNRNQENLTMMDIFSSREDIRDNNPYEYINPEQKFVIDETLEEYQDLLFDELSEIEKTVYDLKSKNLSYDEIQRASGLKNTKGVDNALQRIRHKSEKIINDEFNDGII